MKNNKDKFLFVGFMAFVASILVSGFCSDSVSAHTATLTTASSISLDALPQHDGISIDEESINVATTCRSGYNLSVATSTSPELYLNGDGTSTATFTAVDGTSTLANSTNKWGYTLTSNASSSTVFSPLSTTASVLKTPSQTASQTDIDDTFSIYYGTKVADSVTPGSYQMADSGAIVYYLTVEPTCLLYIVQYQDNGADNPNGMGTTDSSTGEKSVGQINIAEDTKITLLAPNFKKAGHAFLGWSTDSDAYIHFTDNDNTNDPIIYGPMEDVVIDSTMIATANNRNQINMYAVWVPALKDGSNNMVSFQDWDNPNTTLPNDGCSTLTQTVFDDSITNEKGKIIVTKDSFVALTDKRDNEVYTVARLADGNCWMTENLRIEHEGMVGNSINDPSVTNQSLSQGYGGTTGTYGNFVGLAASESANFSNTTASLSFADGGIYKSDDSGDVFNSTNSTLEDIGTSNNPGYRFPRYNNSNNSSALSNPTYTENYANATSPYTSGTYKTSTISSYGNYYTWAAAMANTNYYYSATGTSDSESAGTSICPSNWHLPSSNGATKEFGTLSTSYGGTGASQTSAGTGDIMSNRFRTFPNNFLYSGSFGGSSAYNRGTSGDYWSRSLRDGTKSYTLGLSSAVLLPSDGNYKYDGFSVRCLIRSADVQVALDSNNGTGAVSIAFGVAGSTITLPSSSNPSAAIAKPGYGFKNWNTAPDGSGTSYTSSFTIPAGSTGETLYAQWNPQYTITYVNNCQTYASANSSCTQTVSDGTDSQKINLTNNPSTGTETATLGAYNKFTLTGWKIKGWSTVADNIDNSNPEYRVGTTYTVPSGSSAGDSITLYAHWVPIYTVQYDGNGSDNDSTGMGSTNATTGIKTVAHTNVAEGDTFDLFASNFRKAGYGFIGWSTDQNAWSKLTDSDTTNDAKIWGPNEIITAPPYNGTPITTLYAIWAPAETSGGNPVYLQDWTGCSAMTATTYDSATGTLTVVKDSITALTDERDGEVYTIAKLADENCWMVENLRLADTHQESGNTIATTLTTTNTNILASNNTLPITNIYNADPALATTSNSLSPTSSVSYNASSAPYGWCTNDNAACDDQSRLNTTNTVANITPSQTQNITSVNAHANFNNTIYAYGNYYNWYSATAGYGTYSRNTSTPTNGDLCPAGWHLPYGSRDTGNKGGNTSGGFYYLANRMTATSSSTINSNKFRTFPNNFIYAGSWYGGSAGNRGYKGSYWSASASNYNFYAYNLNLDSANIYPSNYYSKYYGYSVRCVASFTYTISFDANGGTGTMSNQSVPVGTATNLMANSFSYTGYEFAGWNTAADGSGTSYSNTQSVTDIALPGRIITLYAQWDAVCPADKICYRANGSDVEGTMGQQDVASTDTSIELLASNYSRAGYGFAGWNTAADGTGTNYGPQETIEFTAGQYSTTGLKLYAKWVASAGDLQNWSGCSSLASGAVTALTDQRDNETYAVAKLADGNCWMIENMRLENTGADNTNGSLAQGYNASFAGLANPEAPWANNSTTTNSLYSTDGSTDKTISGSNQGYRFPRYNNVNTPTTATDRPSNPTSSSATNSTTNASMYSYGNYYTWAAAIADTTDYTTNNQSVTSTSICPSGWHLPKGGNNQNTANNEFLAFTEALIGTKPAHYDSQTNPSYKTAIGNSEGTDASNALRAYPNNFVYSGYMNSGSVYYRGTYGNYWSSTAYTNTSAYNLYFNKSRVDPGTYSVYKYSARTIRCVASGA